MMIDINYNSTRLKLYLGKKNLLYTTHEWQISSWTFPFSESMTIKMI